MSQTARCYIILSLPYKIRLCDAAFRKKKFIGHLFEFFHYHSHLQRYVRVPRLSSGSILSKFRHHAEENARMKRHLPVRINNTAGGEELGVLTSPVDETEYVSTGDSPSAVNRQRVYL